MEPYQTKNLFAQERFEELAAMAEDETLVSTFTEWDFSYVCRALYKLKEYEAVIRLYKLLHRKYPDSDRLNDMCGWALYHARLKAFDFEHGDGRQFKAIVDYILAHCASGNYSPRNWIACFMAETIQAGRLGKPGNLEEADRYLSMADPAQLSDVPGQSGEGRELASARERWYGHKIKLMKSLARWEDCYAWAEKGLGAFTRFHSNSDVWWGYYQAMAMRMMGKPDEARTIMDRVTASGGFRHWALWQELFQDYKALGEQEKALRYLAQAMTDRSAETDKLVRLFDEAADYLRTLGEEEISMLHRRLAAVVREENGWRVKAQQEREAEEISERIAAMGKGQVLKELRPVWNAWLEQGRDWLTGTVDRLLRENRAGFIRAENGQSYYFSARDIRGRRDALASGARVRFALEERLNRKKNQLEKNAVDITLLQDAEEAGRE